jgi:hypothetical protein
MKVAAALRQIIEKIKRERGIDVTFKEERIVGIGYKFYLKAWSDPEHPKFSQFIISDETFATYEMETIEKYIQGRVEELVEEFL